MIATAIQIRGVLTADQLTKMAAAHEKLKQIHSQMDAILGPPDAPPHLSTAMRHEPAPISLRRSSGRGLDDQAAIRTLIERYQGRVGRFVRSMLGDDSEWEDVAQATFVKLILGIERLQSVESSSRGCSGSRAIPASTIYGVADGVDFHFMGAAVDDRGQSACARVRGSTACSSAVRAYPSASRSARTYFVDARERLELRRSRPNNRM